MDTNANLIPSTWPANVRGGLAGADAQAAARYLFQTTGFLADSAAAETFFSTAVSLPEELLAAASRASFEPFFEDWLDEQAEELLAQVPNRGWLRLPYYASDGALDLETLANWLESKSPETRLLAETEHILGKGPFYLDAWGFGAAQWRGVYALGPGLAGAVPEAEYWPSSLSALCVEFYPLTLPEQWRKDWLYGLAERF